MLCVCLPPEEVIAKSMSHLSMHSVEVPLSIASLKSSGYVVISYDYINNYYQLISTYNLTKMHVKKLKVHTYKVCKKVQRFIKVKHLI